MMKRILPYIAAALIGLTSVNAGSLQSNNDERKTSIESILDEYGEIKEWKDSQNERFYIIASDYNHLDIDLRRNASKAFSELVEDKVFNELGLEGRFDGSVETIDEESPIRNEYYYASKGEWDKVNAENYLSHGVSLVALAYPGVELVGIDNSEKVRLTAKLAENMKKFPGWAESIMRRIKEVAYERSVDMADYLENHPAFGDTVGVMVGERHVDQIIENLSPESGYVVFRPDGGEVIERDYLDVLEEMEKYVR